MPSEDYFIPTDLDALRMENELLTLENTFLKGRQTALDQELKAARELEARLRKELEEARAAARARR